MLNIIWIFFDTRYTGNQYDKKKTAIETHIIIGREKKLKKYINKQYTIYIGNLQD